MKNIGVFIIISLVVITSCTKSNTTDPNPPPPQKNITVINPVSGELLYWHSSYTINWMKEGDVGNVDLFYRINDDSLWIKIDSNLTNLSYNWTIPQYRTNKAKIKISSTEDTSIYDLNTGYFIMDSFAEQNFVLIVCDSYFNMGSDSTETGHMPDESPVHTVYFSPFYLSPTEISNIEYKNFCDAAGYPYPPDPGFQGMTNYFDSFPSYPVVMVSWFDAARFCNWLSRRDGYTEQYDTTNWQCSFTSGYRLPTEAEWEFASRGNLDQKLYPWGDEVPGILCNWRDDGLYEYTSPVRSFQPNFYLLYDMSGNVWEWTNDYYDQNYYQNSPANDPTGPGSGFYRVIRGGSWFDYEENIRCAKRGPSDPADVFIKANTLGFRIVKGF